MFITLISLPVTCVNWLRAKARHCRWEEEIELVKHEMMWTQLWFHHQSEVWKSRESNAAMCMDNGHRAYAAKQVWVWTQFLDDAKKAFAEVMNE